MDCTPPCLPPGVRIAPCARFDGWCLVATRGFAAGELVYLYTIRLVGPDTRALLHTELGTRVVTFPEFGIPLQPEALADLGEDLLQQLGRHYGHDPADLRGLWDRLTGHGTRVHMFAGFDELINHASVPNCTFPPRPARLLLDGPEPVSVAELRALRAIAAGDELTVDYGALLPGWVAPAGWAP